jgi:hypothetical protein
MERLSAEEFERIRNCYTRLNDSFPETLIFRVGSSSGFYSEACSMMECMMFCYLNNIRFSLYSADANFSKAGRGWREFFDSFCPENHQHWNQSFNHRHSPPALRQMIKDSLSGKMGLSDQVRNWLSLAGRHLLLKKEGAKYLTNDFFKIFTSAHFKSSPIHWPLFSMDGSVYPEIAKLFPYAMRHNQETHEEITQIRNSLGLPNSYASVQMRGGDKIAKLERRGDVSDARTLSAAHSTFASSMNQASRYQTFLFKPTTTAIYLPWKKLTPSGPFIRLPGQTTMDTIRSNLMPWTGSKSASIW